MGISVVIPAHNEGSNLGKLVAAVDGALGKISKDYQIVVVNDNSTDDSEAVLEKLRKDYKSLKPVQRRGKKGVGNTLREGFKNCDHDIVISMDGDFSHRPKDIPVLYNKLMEGYDVVVGSRYIEGGSMDNKLSRFMISKGFAIFANVLGLPIHDATSGFRAHRKKVLDTLNLESIGFEIHAEIPMKAKKMGYKVSEAPIVYEKRAGGASNLSYLEQGPGYVKILIKSALGI